MIGQGSLLAIAVLVLVVVAVVVIDRVQKARRRQAFVARYGSLDGLKRELDTSALRGIRDEHGEIHAVRELRRRVPELPLDQAVALVRQL